VQGIFPFSIQRQEALMTPPETRFAQSGDASIAYQVLGQGPPDIVIGSGIEFDECGLFALKGFPEEWNLFKVRP
jgi:hypothetical protein